jgi:hypothetical protein
MNPMNRDKEIEEELKDLSPGFPGKSFMAAPQGYFEQLPDSVMQKWQAQKPYSAYHLLTLRRMIAAAAVITGLCLGVLWWTNQSSATNNSLQISSSEAYSYILENMEEFSPLLMEEPQVMEDELLVPEPSAVEEYLIEELEGVDIETIF